ncbi:tannase-domain-containing protein [Aspergillus eucalypticola CBS 122712]|uniref:Carboxylic ester hydrolase n=1 Tax=Aspergillus eucalypticola (strain CBS 122712 / IBT 29274) TaxID=1448314 RepID=A0A317WE81_ASPEC|nr:tannase-domain-containing protein [Aspergillus eucalypticola CBS 122712]PWY84021.1 tannase-domain-containing protein [Aspergillus eucalypticola CBS 122712]
MLLKASQALPDIPGLKILSITAFSLQDYPITGVQVNPIQSQNVTISFWNVTVTYTHPGWDDLIHAHVWLPLSGWNNRLQAVGGGGWAGLVDYGTLALPVYQGFAAAGSDMGHDRIPWSAKSWALEDASGHVNFARLADFFSTCLYELSLLAEYIIQEFYGTLPAYSYWNGCSTGGRQGLEIAQRWPDAFDAVTYCDGQDGVVDGIIALPSLCNFNPLILIGMEVWCESIPSIITAEVALLAVSYWAGLTAKDGTPLWYGFNQGTPWNYTICTATDDIGNHRCHSLPDYLSVDWLQFFVAQDPNIDLVDMDQAEFEKVQLRDPSVQDFYLYFEAPGVEHCGNGKGPAPTLLMESLMAWVEEGIAPDHLHSVSENGGMSRILLCRRDPTIASSFVCH